MIRYRVIYGLARYLINSVQDMILRRRRFHSQIIPGPCGTKQHCLFNSSHDGPVAGRRLLGVGHSPNGTRRMQLLQLTTCSLLGITTLYYMFTAISCSLRHFDHVFTFHAVEGCEILHHQKDGWNHRIASIHSAIYDSKGYATWLQLWSLGSSGWCARAECQGGPPGRNSAMIYSCGI